MSCLGLSRKDNAMDEYAEIYFLDEDEYVRNAGRDHRTSRPGATGMGRGMQLARRAPIRPSQAVMVRPSQVRRPVMVTEQRRENGLANLDTGQLVEVGSQILAAIQPLPAAPVATGKVESDVENLILFQGALALHAKRDEQLRTIGSLVAKLLG
jgi:hypothetical protein